jgi:hypothetical protein
LDIQSDGRLHSILLPFAVALHIAHTPIPSLHEYSGPELHPFLHDTTKFAGKKSEANFFCKSNLYSSNSQNFTKSLAPPLSYIYIGNNFTAAISSLVFMFLCLGLNILTLIAYRAHRKAFEMTTKAKMERKMTIYALLTLIGQLIISIYMVREKI